MTRIALTLILIAAWGGPSNAEPPWLTVGTTTVDDRCEPPNVVRIVEDNTPLTTIDAGYRPLKWRLACPQTGVCHYVAEAPSAPVPRLTAVCLSPEQIAAAERRMP